MVRGRWRTRREEERGTSRGFRRQAAQRARVEAAGARGACVQRWRRRLPRSGARVGEAGPLRAQAGAWEPRRHFRPKEGKGAHSVSTRTLCMTSQQQIVVAVQSLSQVPLSAAPGTAARQASLSVTNSRTSPKLMSMESVMPSNCPILSRPLLLPPSISPSIRVSSDESALRIRWPTYCNFSFSISPSSEHPGLISFRMDWLDLLAVQGTRD